MKTEKANKGKMKPRFTFRLKNWRIPREAYVHGFTLGGNGLWATPTCHSRRYPNAEMTDTGSRVCTGSSHSTSTWMLENQMMIMEVNHHALAWHSLLRFVRTDLLDLIPGILNAQRAYLEPRLNEGLFDVGYEVTNDDLIVLRSYATNLQVIMDHYPDAMPVPDAGYYEDVCRWLSQQNVQNTGYNPLQMFLLDQFKLRGAAYYVPLQIKIWKACEILSMLPLACQLPEVGPDMEDLGDKAWDLLWWPVEHPGAVPNAAS